MRFGSSVVSRAQARRCSLEHLEQRLFMAADLTASFTTVPTSFLPGGKNKVVLRVNNTGDAPVSGATLGVNLFASTDGTLDGADLPVFNLSKRLTVRNGSGANVNLAFTSPANIPDGDYTLLAQVDSANVVAENDENNNTAASTATVQIRQPFVDLAGSAAVTPGTINVVAGRKVKAPKVALAVTNNGNVSASGNVTATVFASRDASVGGNDVQLGTVTKRLNAKPGKATKIAAKLTVPQDLRSGEYNIVATYAFTGTIAETNTSDNNAASSARITVNNPAFPPGAEVGALTVDSSVIAVNTPEQLIFDIQITDIPAGETLTAELTELNADGSVIGKVGDLLDNGSAANSDATANDGIFSTNTAISFTAPGDRFFRATIGGTTSSTSATIKVTGINPPSEADVQNTITAANTRQAAVTASVTGGMSPSAAIQQAATSLASQPDVAPGSVRVGNSALSYLNLQGILTILSANTSTAPTSQSAEFFADAAALQASAEEGGFFPPTSAALEGEIGDRAIVLSGFASGNPFAAEATSFANKLLNPPSDLPSQVTFNVAGPTFEAGVDAFKGLGQNKVIYFSGESVITPDGISFETGETATAVGSLTRAADLVSQRIAVGGDGKYILTPRFFSHYNGDMDGAIVFADFDNSTQDNSLATPFLRRGAKAFYGFTTSAVSAGNGVTIATATVDQLLRQQTVQTAADIGGATVADGVFTFFGTGEAKLELGNDLVSENDLFVTYTWNQNVRDLDTATEFLGATAGFSCSGPNEFMTFTGDNTSGGGSETVTINLQGALAANMLTSGTLVTTMAGWFASAGGSGPAVLTVGLKNKLTGEERQVLTRSISPGTQSDCASTVVGVVTINLTQEGTPRVAIGLS